MREEAGCVRSIEWRVRSTSLMRVCRREGVWLHHHLFLSFPPSLLERKHTKNLSTCTYTPVARTSFNHLTNL